MKNDNQEKIFGGIEAEINVWKFMVNIKTIVPVKEKVHSCGGLILNACYILTAAHCL